MYKIYVKYRVPTRKNTPFAENLFFFLQCNITACKYEANITFLYIAYTFFKSLYALWQSL